MLIVGVPSEELKAASVISNSLSLIGMRLRFVQVEESGIEVFFDHTDTEKVNLNIDYRTAMKDLLEGKSLSSTVEVDVKLTKRTSFVKYKVQYLAEYSLPAVPFPENVNRGMFEAFSKHNSLLNCWPYLRAQINSLSLEVGLPVTLPLLKLVANKEPVVNKVTQDGSL